LAGRNPYDAVNNYMHPLKEALHCITEAPLALHCIRNLEVDEVNSATLGAPTPVRLKGAPLAFYAAQWFKIVEIQTGDERGRYRVTTVEYAYTFLESSGNRRGALVPLAT
jgi:hypothetical protein